MRTADVKKLMETVLDNIPKPYSEDVIEEVFLQIEQEPELRSAYDGLVKQLGKNTVNTWGGYWVAAAAGKMGVAQVPSKKSKLIQTYSRLTAPVVASGKKRKEAEAVQLMSDYYMQHKSTLPQFIRNHREDIVEMIAEGLPVEQVFAMQIDGTPPAAPAGRRR
jgi:hypothetical protein